MSDTDQLLEILQADVFAVLQNTPGLATANVLADNEGDIESRVARALATMTATGGKSGLAVVVLLPEVDQAEANLPGPAMGVKVEIRVLENVLLNRNASKGTLIRSSQAALRVLAALHLRGLGSRLLYAQKDPITPVEVKKGHVSHAVTLHCRVSGFRGAGRPAQVMAEWTAGGFMVSGTFTPAFSGYLPPSGMAGGKTSFFSGGTVYPRALAEYDDGSNGWLFEVQINEAFSGYWFGAGDVATPDLVGNWVPVSGDVPETGQPTFTPVAGAVTLACATAGAEIRHTTDGSFPSSAATLYTGPIAGLETGTEIRAAAHQAGMEPGDVTEITIIE